MESLREWIKENSENIESALILQRNETVYNKIIKKIEMDMGFPGQKGAFTDAQVKGYIANCIRDCGVVEENYVVYKLGRVRIGFDFQENSIAIMLKDFFETDRVSILKKKDAYDPEYHAYIKLMIRIPNRPETTWSPMNLFKN